MKWRSKMYDWKRRFAILPIHVDGYYYWLVWYWKQDMGLYTAVRFTDPSGETK